MGKKIAALSTAIVALMGGLTLNISPAMATDWTFQELWENKLKLDSESNCDYDFECEKNFYLEQRLLSDLNRSTRTMNENGVMITAFNLDTGVMRIVFNNHNIHDVWRNKLEGIPEKLAVIKIRWFYEGSEPLNGRYYDDEGDFLYYEAYNSDLIQPNQEIEIKMGEPIKDGKRLTTYHSLEYALVDGHSTTKVAREALDCARKSPLYEYGKECQVYFASGKMANYKLMWADGMEPKEPELTESTGSETGGSSGSTEGSSGELGKDDEKESGKGSGEESGNHEGDEDHGEVDGNHGGVDGGHDDDDGNKNDLSQDNNYSSQISDSVNDSSNNGGNQQSNGEIGQGLITNNSSNIANLSQIGAPNTGVIGKRDANEKSFKQNFFGLALFIAAFALLDLVIFTKNRIKSSSKAKK